MTEEELILDVKTETWSREINEIVNYDSKELFKTDLKIQSKGFLYRLLNRIFFIYDQTNLDEYELLMNITKNENNYELNFNEYKFDETGNINTTNSAWFVLKKRKINDKANKYQLKKGDIIKIGRIYTKIKDIKYEKDFIELNKSNIINSDIISNQSKISNKANNKNNINKLILNDINNISNTEKSSTIKRNKINSLANQRNATDSNLEDKIQILSLNNNNNKNKKENHNNNNNEKITNSDMKENSNIVKSDNKTNNKICRICYLEEESPLENPLIQPCICTGSLKYIHLNCLKHWIMTKSCEKVEDSDFCYVFLFKEVQCEICKTKFPDLIKHNNKYYYLLEFSNIFKNYLILETLTIDEENNKFIYVIDLSTNQEIKIGRSILSDILLSDISVSRIHCKLSIEKNNIFIQDNDSKFGTLVLIQTPSIKMTQNLDLNIQVGRTYLNFLIFKQSKNFFSCCDVNEKSSPFFYYRQNDKQVKLNSVVTIKNDAIDINDKEESLIKNSNNDNDDNNEDIKDDNEDIKDVNEDIKDVNEDIKDNEDDNKNNDIVIDNNDDESIKIVIENE